MRIIGQIYANFARMECNHQIISHSTWVKNVTNNHHLDDTCSAWFYNDILHNLNHSLKYNDWANFCFDLSILYGGEILLHEIGDINMIIPVPLNCFKKRKRGYNQSFWLAKGLAFIYAVPVDNSIIMRTTYIFSQTMWGVLRNVW